MGTPTSWIKENKVTSWKPKRGDENKGKGVTGLFGINKKMGSKIVN